MQITPAFSVRPHFGGMVSITHSGTYAPTIRALAESAVQQEMPTEKLLELVAAHLDLVKKALDADSSESWANWRKHNKPGLERILELVSKKKVPKNIHIYETPLNNLRHHNGIVLSGEEALVYDFLRQWQDSVIHKDMPLWLALVQTLGVFEHYQAEALLDHVIIIGEPTTLTVEQRGMLQEKLTRTSRQLAVA